MEHFLILAIIVAALLLFAFEVIRPDLVALSVCLALMALGLVTVQEGFSGFSNPAVITVLGMFILSAGLIRTGVADWIAAWISRVGGKSPVRLILTLMLAVGAMSAFMNNIGAVAVLLPTTFIIARKAGIPAAKLLIPLSFGSLMGGLVTLIGTPPNLLASMALQSAGYAGFKLFDFAPTGLVLLVAGAAYMAFIGRHLLPDREAQRNYAESYQLENYLTEVEIPEGSPLAGGTLAEADLRGRFGLSVLRITRKKDDKMKSITPRSHTPLVEGDRLVVQGDLTKLMEGKDDHKLRMMAGWKYSSGESTGQESEWFEMVVAPRSQFIGRSVKNSEIHHRFGVTVIALRRHSQNISRDFAEVPLAAADVLLVQGPQNTVKALSESSDFLIVKSVEQRPKITKKAPLALGIMFLSILSAGLGWLEISQAAMTGVLLMVLTGCVRVEEMYKAVDWQVILLIACMLPLGIAMDSSHTGTAGWLAQFVVLWSGSFGPWVVMGVLFLFTTILTEVMSNAAAAVLLAPIAIAMAVGMDIEPYAFVMTVAIASSTTFLTPIGHQSNILVYSAGGYRFWDFAKVGFPMNVLAFAIAMFVVPLVWPFEAL